MKNRDAVFDTSVTRDYIPEGLIISSWKDVESFFSELLERPINTKDELKRWLKDRSELEAVLQEDLGWRYIRMSCDTSNDEFSSAFNFFVSEIQPQISPASHKLDQKLLEAPALKEIADPSLEIVTRQIRMRVNIFREENIPLIAELQQLEQQFSAVTGVMTIAVDGQEITLQQASNYLEQSDRDRREEVYRKIQKRRLQDRENLDDLFDQLLKIRNKVAINAGFKNFRDYMFASLGRFDYSPDDCYRFHEAVEKQVVPLVKRIEESQKKKLGVEELRPWDLLAEPAGKNPLRPSADSNDLMQKTIRCFHDLDPFLGDCMQAMLSAGRIDLESRKGKAPGGYNYPLYETGLPFIFMNSTNTLRDLVTIVHEGGHAIQSILDKPLELVDYKSLPSEVAELASMSMELMSMEKWSHFFSDENDLKRAQKKHLEDILKGLPWIAAVDAFQDWIYLHPEQNADERRKAWSEIYFRFNPSVVNWNGLADILENMWQKQLHIFEVPFYYIEYGFAQLGAIAVWRNYKSNPKKALADYTEALKLGYTKTIGEIYGTANVNFRFSEEYVKELCDFVNGELLRVAE